MIRDYWKEIIAGTSLIFGLTGVLGNYNFNDTPPQPEKDVIIPASMEIPSATKFYSRRSILSRSFAVNNEPKTEKSESDLNDLDNFVEVLNSDPFSKVQPKFIPAYTMEDFGAKNLCTGGCAYVPQGGGSFTEYDFIRVVDKIRLQYCYGEENCDEEEYTMNGIYVILNEEGYVERYGLIDSNKTGKTKEDYFKEIDSDEEEIHFDED